MGARSIGFAALLAGAVACGPRRASLDVPAPAPPEPSGLTVTLEWSVPVDLDLYVTDPAWETFYYARRGDVLAADARCGASGPPARRERARFAAPRPGRYRIGVDFPDPCDGGPRTVPFRLLVDLDGSRREVPGTAALGRRDPAVVEIEVP